MFAKTTFVLSALSQLTRPVTATLPVPVPVGRTTHSQTQCHITEVLFPHSANLLKTRLYSTSRYNMGDENWRDRKERLKAQLTPMQYFVTQEKGTEKPGSGAHLKVSGDGNFHCVVCDSLLFRTAEKYESGSGWPSFWDLASQDSVRLVGDLSAGMERTEVVCKQCGAHLGHVFDDGPKPTNKRYCINSAALDFKPGASSGAGD